MTNLKPMDVYSSRMDIPFNVAAYCRGHKLSVEAVNYAKAIQAAHAAKLAEEDAQRRLGQAEMAMLQALQAVLDKMERDPI
jgi:hypothetical protein